MDIEYEATFCGVNKDTARKVLANAGAILVRPEFMQIRKVFALPEGRGVAGGWVRVRDEADKVTMSLKVINGTAITDQKETYVEVGNFKAAASFLQAVGCREKAVQESKRELWKLGDVEVTIDEWPFLEPFVEIEGPSEELVKKAADALGFNWNQAKFCAVGALYSEKYGLPEEVINNQIPEIMFSMSNPFIKE